MRAPRIQGASRRRGVPFPEGRRTGAGPSAGRVRRRPAPGDNGPPARELTEGPRPRAAGNGEKNNDGRPAMTSIDGLLAILEDRGLMPAVALFSLTAVLGLLYLSSGNGTPLRRDAA